MMKLHKMIKKLIITCLWEETFGREVIRANRYGQAAEKQVLVF